MADQPPAPRRLSPSVEQYDTLFLHGEDLKELIRALTLSWPVDHSARRYPTLNVGQIKLVNEIWEEHEEGERRIQERRRNRQ